MYTLQKLFNYSTSDLSTTVETAITGAAAAVEDSLIRASTPNSDHQGDESDDPDDFVPMPMGNTVAHKIDPEPDTVITLKHGRAVFAEWKQPIPSLLDKKSTLEQIRPAAELIVAPIPQRRNPATAAGAKRTREDEGDEDDDEDRTLIPSPKRVKSAEDFSSDDDHFMSDASTRQGNEDLEDEVTAEYHVSSRHLKLGSPRFRTVLSGGPWKGGIRSPRDRPFHIEVTNWDPEAFLILMNIFHTRNRKVPREVSLEMLAKIAALVDYYDCREAVEMFSELWIKKLKRTVPTTYCRELILWLCISSVFGLPTQYEKTSRVALQFARQEVPNLGLPIPRATTDAIDRRREAIIAEMLNGLHQLLDTFLAPDYCCPSGADGDGDRSFQCGSIMMGSLMRQLQAFNILIPRPRPPFNGLSIQDMLHVCDSIRSPEWFHDARGNRHECNLCTDVKMIRTPLDRVQGLKLTELGVQE